ncbi:MAG: hypothetical protein AB8G86_04445 [Saprospiraceae bacterium]
MRKQPIKIFLFASLLLCLLISCKKERVVEAESEEMNNTGVALGPEIMRLGNFFGNVSSDVVLINLQNGPSAALATNELKDLFNLTERDNDFFVFNLHQQQTLEAQDFTEEITFEAAKKNKKKSVDILIQTIQHFKVQDKKVYVLGIAFGAYLVQELLVREGTNLADQYLLMAGRLDIPDLIWQSFQEGNTGGFIDGTTPFTGAPSTLTPIEKNHNKLFAALASNRYTVELSTYNDLTNVT